MAHTFTPPSDLIVPNVSAIPHPMNRLMGHFRQNPRARNVYKLHNGTYTDNVVQDQGIAQTISQNGSGATGPLVDFTYWGATTTIVTDSETAALQAAGYTTDTTGIFDPRPIPGLLWWLAADRLTATNGQLVSLWPDTTNQEPALTQPTTSLQPTFVAVGLNGLPAVQFDGVDDNLTGFFHAATPTPYTAMAVTTWTRAAADLLLDGPPVTGAALGANARGLVLTRTGVFYANPTVTSATTAVYTLTPGSYLLTISVDSQNVITYRVNGAVVATASPSVADRDLFLREPPIIRGFTLGARADGGQPFQGSVSEIALWGRSLDSAELVAAEGMLRTKYNL